MANVDPILTGLELASEVNMALTFTLWLGRLLSSTAGVAPLPPSAERKPMEIQVERLPDYLWRDLGFPPLRRRDGE